MNGSLVTAKIAGTESTANTRSVISTQRSDEEGGREEPPRLAHGETPGRVFRARESCARRSGRADCRPDGSRSSWKSSLTPVSTRKPPKTLTPMELQQCRAEHDEDGAHDSAPRMPQNNTRWM